MENIKKITILENDQLHENNPLDFVFEIVMNKNKHIKFDIWDWFNNDIIQNKEKSIERLKLLSQDEEHVFLVYTSFAGYDNSLSGWVFFLSQLADLGIKLKIYLIYGGDEEETLLAETLRWQSDLKGYGKAKYEQYTSKLIKSLECHEIRSITYPIVYLEKKSDDIFSAFNPVTIDLYNSYLFNKKEMVRIKETGEVKQIIYVYYWKTLEASHVDLIMDEENHALHEAGKKPFDKSNYKRFSLSEIEKI